MIRFIHIYILLYDGNLIKGGLFDLFGLLQSCNFKRIFHYFLHGLFESDYWMLFWIKEMKLMILPFWVKLFVQQFVKDFPMEQTVVNSCIFWNHAMSVNKGHRKSLVGAKHTVKDGRRAFWVLLLERLLVA